MSSNSSITVVNGWRIDQFDEYLRIDVDGSPGYITIKLEAEGFVVDIWPDVGNESVGTTSALFTELEPE